MYPTEPLTDYLMRHLKAAGTARFQEIADASGVRVSFIRKFFYGMRENPRVKTIQPLIDYFQATTAGPAQSNKSAVRG
ncbi:hypothetical protein [uncultured Xylophilus sp.]|uniref:hypothetical protein n=1 Tax=uncultured Xylophilus sp. TaxID=296832 RepID=UPI0025E1A04E|nr:hypothetical protein [uncultured Xylophilus sp.]